MFQPSVEFLEYGAKKVERACEVYKRYFATYSTEDIINHFIQETL
jgi:hypothetical protein